MLVIGLTGGIGCGKSLISDFFYQQFNIPIIDADIISRELTQTKQVIDKISKQLGPEFVDKNEQLLREKLRQAIFSDQNLRDELEKILHPLVYEQINKKLFEIKTSYCIIVIPLLLETQRTELIDRVLVVDCKVEEQISRVMLRDTCDEEHVRKIIASQIDRSTRLSQADDVIENSGSIEELKEKVASLHKKYFELSKHKT